MDIVIFILLFIICISLVYLVHRYFGKNEFYLLTIIYSILSFLMSFKLINLFGVDINASIIPSSGLLIIWYYFINRYKDESKKFIISVLVSTFSVLIFMILGTFMVPSIYDETSVIYNNLVLESIVTSVFYPISLIITLLLSGYCFEELKKENNKRFLKTIITVIGILFIDIFVFVYFNYALLVRFDKALVISIDNYLLKIVIMVVYLFIINKIFVVRKVK